MRVGVLDQSPVRSGGTPARLFKAHVQVGDHDPQAELLDPVWALLPGSASASRGCGRSATTTPPRCLACEASATSVR